MIKIQDMSELRERLRREIKERDVRPYKFIDEGSETVHATKELENVKAE